MVYWKGMRQAIKQYVAACEVCQQNKHDTLSPGGLLQPLPLPLQVWSEVSMDFITELPKAKGKDVIMVVVDRLTKYGHFFALGHPFSARDVARQFISGVVRLHGFPYSIVSDRDQIFLSLFWTELFRKAGTRLKYSTAYHPQTDGQTKVVNRCLETYLRCFVSSRPKQWPEWLDWAEYWFNTTYNASSRMTPFWALYGRDPPLLVRGDTYPTKLEEVRELQENRDRLLDELKSNLQQA